MVELNQRTGRDPRYTRELTIKPLTQAITLAPSNVLEKHASCSGSTLSHLYVSEENGKHRTRPGKCVQTFPLVPTPHPALPMERPEAVQLASAEERCWALDQGSVRLSLAHIVWSLHIDHSLWHLSDHNSTSDPKHDEMSRATGMQKGSLGFPRLVSAGSPCPGRFLGELKKAACSVLGGNKPFSFYCMYLMFTL